MSDRQFARLREQVELLAGDRGGTDKAKTAVRRGEFRALAGRKIQSAQITGVPSQDDYNRLQADVAAIYAALAQISNLSGDAQIPKL